MREKEVYRKSQVSDNYLLCASPFSDKTEMTSSYYCNCSAVPHLHAIRPTHIGGL
jgi:hypothetical protein